MLFLFKVILSGCIIALASKLASKDSVLAGFLVALPLVSMLSILFTYGESHDMNKVNQFAISILVAIPLSLTFFAPFLLNKWFKMGFLSTYVLGLIFLTAAYLAHKAFLKWFLN